MILELDPSHPTINEPINLKINLEGEEVLSIEPEIGFLHRGFEKQAENATYLQVIPYTERLNYQSSIINSIGYVMAVEKLLQVEVPQQTEYERIILSEISRIIDHLTNFSYLMKQLGADTFFSWALKAREYLWEIMEICTGARLTASWPRFGNNIKPFPEGFLQKLTNRIEKTQRTLKEIRTLFIKNKLFIDQLRDVGVLSWEQAISYGFSGPLFRATGVAHDLRLFDGGYSLYHEFDFEIPIGTIGDCYDRFLIRLEEINQSISIIQQAKEKLPHSNGHSKKYHTLLDVQNFESLEPPVGEVYTACEGGNGEVGFYIVSDGSEKPLKCRVRPPCFNFLAAMNEMVKGHSLADIIPIFCSLNIVSGELDR
ncbi:MAG: NADH-quinone oxidoreductase subunit D [bacterium]|jgi:NADH-quinone oxidoreductase subunit D